MNIIKIFILLFLIPSCNGKKNIKDIYINKTQKVAIQGSWKSDYKISYLWLKPQGPDGHQSTWIINDDVMLFTPDKVGIYSISVSIENSMGEILGNEEFYYNAINKNNHSTKLLSQKTNIKINKKIEETTREDTYSIQISSWSNMKNAEKALKKVIALGFDSYIDSKKINGKDIYRVKVGKNLSYQKSLQIKNQLKKQKIIDCWIDKNQ